jgi:catechol 2,3-dioxygenase-like lactoylglutathione lyase family enzyme
MRNELLLDGVNHIGMVTNDIDRLTAFYRDVFGCESRVVEDNDEINLTFIDIGERRELNVFTMKKHAPQFNRGDMFTNGALDHIGLQAKSKEAFDEIRRRLMAKGATDGFVTDFGMALSCFFRDPDGLGGEVLITVPGATHTNPPGTKAEGYEVGVP